MILKPLLKRVYWILSSQFGIDPRKTVRALRGLPKYISDFRYFRRRYNGRLSLLPCLQDWYEEAGSANNEYFWQDLLVAKMIYAAKPEKHVDIGSRLDGFVAHVASFRDLEVFDVRPVSVKIPGITFKQADLMQSDLIPEAYCDSLSCLHALEHFGLGRYGDQIEALGFDRGLTNMAKILKNNGTFYLSVPVGEPRVEFNAHRVSNPRSIVRLARDNFLELANLTVIRQGHNVAQIEVDDETIEGLSRQKYSLAIFKFIKKERTTVSPAGNE